MALPYEEQKQAHEAEVRDVQVAAELHALGRAAAVLAKTNEKLTERLTPVLRVQMSDPSDGTTKTPPEEVLVPLAAQIRAERHHVEAAEEALARMLERLEI